MNTMLPASESHLRLPPWGRGLYPVPPFSWFAPLWSYACGVLSSSASSWTGGSLLTFLFGLLLAGPLLGTAWRASEQIRCYRELATDPSGNARQKPVISIPYTLPGSAGHQLLSRLGLIAARWQRASAELGTPLLQLAASTVFSLALATQLGQRTLVLAAIVLVCAYARSRVGDRWAAPGPPNGAERAGSPMDVFLPILLTWLIGHAAYAAIRPESVLIAACYALTLCGCSQVHRTGKGLLRLLLPQVVAIAYLAFARQPIAAAGVTLLASAQLLWAPLLQTPAGRAAYSRAIQLPLAASMLLSAWTLGYGP